MQKKSIFIAILLLSIFLGMPTNGEVQAYSKEGNVFQYRFNEEKLINFLGISKSEYLQAIKDRKSLAEIAKQQGITEHELINYLSKEMTKELGSQFKDGKINSDTYNALKRDMKLHIQDDIHFIAPKKEPKRS